MTHVESAKVVIIGGGPAGYTAAIYAARAGLAPLCVEGYSSGGQIIRSGGIHNFPGFPDGVSGQDLAELIRAQAAGFGARFVMAEVESVDLDAAPFRVRTDDKEYAAESLIVATGATARRLGLQAEFEYEGRGVAYCAICDGAFFAGKKVAVVGGGDAAVEEAIALAGIAESVVLVHRRTTLRANAGIQAVLRDTGNITVHTPYVVDDILGDDESGVTGLRIAHVDTAATEEFAIDGIFIAIGHEPASQLFTKWLDVDAHGFLRTVPGSTATRVPGVFVAGDVADPRYRQAVTAAATGAASAIDAERWLISSRGERATNVVRDDAAVAYH
jgi:thioredoxin reductase (NADPH)